VVVEVTDSVVVTGVVSVAGEGEKILVETIVEEDVVLLVCNSNSLIVASFCGVSVGEKPSVAPLTFSSGDSNMEDFVLSGKVLVVMAFTVWAGLGGVERSKLVAFGFLRSETFIQDSLPQHWMTILLRIFVAGVASSELFFIIKINHLE
jgi:hypothetical protein